MIKADPSKPRTIRDDKGKVTQVIVTASVPRARDIASRILRGWVFTEVRTDDETSTFNVMGRLK